MFGNIWQSSEVLENVWKRLSGLKTAFGESLKSVWKSLKNGQKEWSLVCLYNKQKIHGC